MDDRKFGNMLGIITLIIWGIGFAFLALLAWIAISIWDYATLDLTISYWRAYQEYGYV